MKFIDDEKETCMTVDSLIPSIDDVLYDMIERYPLDKCLIESLSLKVLECEHPYTAQEISETIIAIDENESTVVVKKKR